MMGSPMKAATSLRILELNLPLEMLGAKLLIVFDAHPER
jgi:hypothetical protein